MYIFKAVNKIEKHVCSGIYSKRVFANIAKFNSHENYVSSFNLQNLSIAKIKFSLRIKTSLYI